MKVGILVCGFVRPQLVPKYGGYDRFFKRLLADEAFSFRDYLVVDNTFPTSVDACDAYLLTGSAHGAYEDLAFIEPLETFIRDAYAAGIPMVGICFGHQILAQALGGRVEKFDGGWGLGVHDYEMDLGAGKTKVRLHAIHQDQVIVPPEEATVIGSSSFCQHAALCYGDRAISFQPHPEFETDFMADLITLRAGKAFDHAIAEKALESLDEPVANGDIAHFIKTFLKQPRA